MKVYQYKLKTYVMLNASVLVIVYLDSHSSAILTDEGMYDSDACINVVYN